MAPDERLLTYGTVVPVKSAEGIKVKHGKIGGMLGDHLMQRYGAQSGRAQSIAAARFRVHYADGSWLAFLTARRRTIETFTTALSDAGSAAGC